MESTKQIKKLARCIKTLLETEGVSVTSKHVVEVIKDKDLSDMMQLKNFVKEQQPVRSDRRSGLKAFIIRNWEQVKDNDLVKDALFNAYCMGRYNKVKRQEMVSELVAECESEVNSDLVVYK
jgi:hypothetical protein